MITDFSLLDHVLTEIERATPMAVLHREPEVANHSVESDVDICVGADPLAVLATVARPLAKKQVLPILVFNYDRGSYSFFFSDARGEGGAQVDLLHDARGVSRYGVRTPVLLAKSQSGIRWPCTDPLDEALYVFRKRLVKGDSVRVAGAREKVGDFGIERVRRRADEIFSPRGATAVRDSLAGRQVRALDRADVFRSRAMRPSRLFRRCGHWALVAGERPLETVQDLSERMERLVATSTSAYPRLPYLLDHLWRPNLVLTAGTPKSWPHADVVLPSTASGYALADLVSQLVSSMHRRVLTTFNLSGTAGTP